MLHIYTEHRSKLAHLFTRLSILFPKRDPINSSKNPSGKYSSDVEVIALHDGEADASGMLLILTA